MLPWIVSGSIPLSCLWPQGCAQKLLGAAAGGGLHLQECKDSPSICTPEGLRRPKSCQRVENPTKAGWKVNCAGFVLLALHTQTSPAAHAKIFPTLSP